MAIKWRVGWVVISTLLFLSSYRLAAQPTLQELRQQLIGQPLYLRGFWMASKLEFDGAGHLRSASEPGPVTLSGIDIQDISFHGKDLVIKAQRAALVAGKEGRLERQSIFSTTHLEFSLRRSPNNKYLAFREVTLLVHPDASGNFDTAVQSIFADGLLDLASSVPPYWRCYAQGYFIRSTDIAGAKRVVAACVDAHTLSLSDPDHGNHDGFTPAKILDPVKPHFSTVAAELGIHGASRVSFTVSQHGFPVGFQIVQAVGGGMDEETLRALSACKFQPAQRKGQPVPADLEFTLQYSVAH